MRGPRCDLHHPRLSLHHCIVDDEEASSMANECLQVLRPGPAALHGQRRCICGARHHSVAVEGGQAKAAEAAGCDTPGELIQGGQAKAAEAAGSLRHGRRANLPLPGAGVSCALVCCRLLQVRGLTVSLSCRSAVPEVC